jgi:uncharacterized Zn finger protein (UPF0148 family)
VTAPRDLKCPECSTFLVKATDMDEGELYCQGCHLEVVLIKRPRRKRDLTPLGVRV